MKLVHAADLHLDSPLLGLERYPGAPVDAIRGATRRAFENLIGLCLDEGAALLLIAGDVYDGDWKDYSTGLFFASQLLRLREVGTRVVLVRGNHDAASQITRHLELPEHVIELPHQRPDTRLFEELGVAVHGQSFPQRSVPSDLASGYPRPVAGAVNFGILHTSLTGREGHADYAPTSVETLRARGYDYWALGHVHRREVVSEDPFIVYPGNLQGRHFQETGEKGATLVELSGGRIARVDHRSLDVVRWASLDVDASPASSADDVVGLVRQAVARAVELSDGRTLAARIVLRGATRAHSALVADPDRWEAQIRLSAGEAGGEDVWVERVAVHTTSELDIARLSERDDAVGQLVRGLAAVRESTPQQAELLALFADLAAKLPLEAREGPDALRLDDPSCIAEALSDVEGLLLPDLLSSGASES